jgi:hypothetical protein
MNLPQVAPSRRWLGFVLRATLGIGLAACRARGDAAPDPALGELAPPAITALRIACDRRAGAWSFEVDGDAWIGGATLMWTVDGGWVERHDGFRSILAGPAGESDTWRLDLRVVDDFRPAGVGGNTAFTCNAAVSALVWVKDLAGEVSDCRQLGAAVEPLLAEEASPPCPTVWEEPADTDG